MTAIDNLEKNSSGQIESLNLSNLKLAIPINQMITTVIFPESFETSKIVLLFKKGESLLLTNYRPISLLPTISKIFERIIHDQMYTYLNSDSLLAEQQYGFRKLDSPEYAAVNIIDHVAKQIWNLVTCLVICMLTLLKRLTLYNSIYCCES